MSSTTSDRDPRWKAPPTGWRGLPIPLRDGIGGLVLFAVSVLPLGVPGVALGELHHNLGPWMPVILIAGQTLPLALRRVAPALGLAVVGVAFAAAQLAGVDTGTAGLGLLIAIYSFAAYQRRHRNVIGIATAVAYILLAAGLHSEGSPERLIDWATFILVLTTPWFIGQLVRRRVAEQAAREDLAAQTAVRESRNLLARDLHDIVTHHVTAMVVQADSAAYLDSGDIGERARVLDTIGSTGRRALQELRSLLGALEQTPSVAPSEPFAGTVAELVAEAQARGYPVTFSEPPSQPDMSEPVRGTLYRIAQEALTNAMKHSPNSPVAVALTERDGRVELRVTNDIGEGSPGAPGRGRTGMSARSSLLGGTFEAGVVDGRFRVLASFDSNAEADQ